MKELRHRWWPRWPSVGNPEVSRACQPVIAFPKMLINTPCVKKEIPLSGLYVQNPPRDGVRHWGEQWYTAKAMPTQRAPLPWLIQAKNCTWGSMQMHCRGQQRTVFLRISTSPKPISFLDVVGGQVSGIPSHMPPYHRAKGKFRETTHPTCFILHKPQKSIQSVQNKSHIEYLN